MPSTHETLDKARSLVEARLAEIEQERKELQKTLRSLGGSSRRGGGRRRRSRGGRGGGRGDQAVKLITDNPGIKVSELGKKMGLRTPHYLYRLLPDLEKEGRIKKKAKGYFPA